MRHIFVVNPTSGGGRAKGIYEKIKEFAEEENLDYEIYISKGHLDAYNFVKNYEDKGHIFHAIGGDGTVNEIASGLIDKTNYLSVIPGGSGNDFYKTIKRSPSLKFKSDICRINDRYFINVANIGFDADICNNSFKMKKMKIPRTQIYNMAILYTFFRFHPRTLDITIDDKKIKQKTLMMTLCNGRIYGGGFKIALDASIDDGLMDIYVVDKVSKPGIIKEMLKLVKGRLHKSKKVTKYKAKKVLVKYKKPIYASFDGEMMKGDTFEFEVLKQKVNIYNDRDFVSKLLDYIKQK